tara:strand:- start:1122 stop:1541 length:420 start_codon:yes stop_codon:yes gene_type:complete
LHYRLKVIVESDCNSLLKTFNINLLFEEVEFMSEEIITTIEQQIQDNPILLYMKGSPQAPQCGFSAQTVQCMVSCGQKFAYVDILSNPEIRSALPAYANWPTFPQLWVEGELVGGCDIITEMFENGELETLLDGAANDP